MATIGNVFPQTRAARKSRLNEIKEGQSVSTKKVPGKGLMHVYRIPLQHLSYNPYNTRFLAQAKTLEKRFGCKLNDENPEHIRAIEKLIWEEKKDKNESTISSLIKDKQLEPGVVTADGVVLAGNRRFRLLNEINRNRDSYQTNKVSIAELDCFEAVILDDEQLDELKIIKYESFYQFGIEDKVEYNPIQKYIAAHHQHSLGFSNKEIATNFMSITENKESKVKEWLEVYGYMEEYLGYIGEEGIYTSLEGREEAFLQLRSQLKGLTSGKTGSDIWAYDVDFDLAELKMVFFDYIRLKKFPTHDFRLFRTIFSDEEQWKNFRDNEKKIVEDEKNTVESFEEYRRKYPEADESYVSETRKNDYTENVETGLQRIHQLEKVKIETEKAEKLPLEILKTIQKELNKLESDMTSSWDKEAYDSDEFLAVIRDIQKRVGRIKQKVD